MARTDDASPAPESRPLGVTVLPRFQPEVAPEPEPAADLVSTGQLSTPGPTHAGSRGARALLRRRAGRAPLVAVPAPEGSSPQPTEAPEPAAPVAPWSVSPVPSAPAAADERPAAVTADAPALQAELERERQRADAAEAANAVLRRRLAQLDDELAQFRPRAVVPFEDSTD